MIKPKKPTKNQELIAALRRESDKRMLKEANRPLTQKEQEDVAILESKDATKH